MKGIYYFFLIFFVFAKLSREKTDEDLFEFGLAYIIVPSDRYECYGGFISTKHVLTSGRCIGIYRTLERNKQFITYHFTPYEIAKFRVETLDQSSYKVEKLFIHNFHAVSTFREESFIFDLGVLKINGEYDTFIPLPFPISEFQFKGCFRIYGKERYDSYAKGEFPSHCPLHYICGLLDIKCPDELMYSLKKCGFRCTQGRRVSIAYSGAPIMCGRKTVGLISKYSNTIIEWTSLNNELAYKFLLEVLNE